MSYYSNETTEQRERRLESKRRYRFKNLDKRQSEFRNPIARNKLRACWNKLPDHPTKPTYEQLEEWIHNAVCHTCRKTAKANGKALALDHNHETGEFRGFLCCDCNLALGYAKDDIMILKSMIEYLENPPARSFF